MSYSEIKNLLPTKYWYLVIATLIIAIALSFLAVNFPWYLAVGALVMTLVGFFIWRQPLLGILLVAFWLPFERLGAFETADTTIRLSQIFLLVTFGIWFFILITKGQFKFAKNRVLIPIVLFLVTGLFALPNILNQDRSLIVFTFIVFTASLAFIIPNLITEKKHLKKLILVIITSFILVSSFGLYQFAGDMLGLPQEVTGLRELYTKDILGFTRVQSTAYEPLYFANYLLLPIALIFTLFLSGRGALKNSWLLVLFSLGIVNLVLTVSRGGYLAIFAVLVVISIYYYKKVFTVKNLVIILVAGFLMGWIVLRALGLGGDVFTLDRFSEHVTNAFYGASYDERVDTFSQAIEAWREQPLFGVGFGGFGPYVAEHPEYMPKDGWRIVNNQFLEILAENGIIGLVLFLFVLLFLFVRSLRAIWITQDKYLKAVMIALLAVLIGIVVQYQTFSTLYIMHIWFVIGLMIAVQNIIIFNHDNN
ncbi:MAG: O-antigen ligase family protein [bacterium]|nr:O-antigen ligase family protein [bacterium]